MKFILSRQINMLLFLLIFMSFAQSALAGRLFELIIKRNLIGITMLSIISKDTFLRELNLPNELNQTPLDLAELYKFDEISEFLKSFGAVNLYEEECSLSPVEIYFRRSSSKELCIIPEEDSES